MASNKKHEEEFIPKKYKKEDALKDLDDLDDSPFLLSSVKDKIKKEEKTVDVDDEPVEDNWDWMSTLDGLRAEKRGKGKSLEKIFDENLGKKKKKKKKKQGELIDHTDDFEKEIMLLQDILKDQTKLSSSLQARYDALDRQKSSARGVGKFTTDLITTLNTSRSLCKDIVKEISNIKKNVADLNMKEREKFAKQLLGGDGEDMNQFAASYLKQIMGANKDIKDASGDYAIDDVDADDDLFDEFEDIMRNGEGYVERSADAKNYLKYENRSVSVKVLWDDDSDTGEFFAEDEEGNIIDDYPLPATAASLSVNRSTRVATDKYGQKYGVVFK